MTSVLFEAKTAHCAAHVADGWALQGVPTLGAKLAWVQPGAVDTSLDWAEGLAQLHGFLHAGIASTALDSACGDAGLALVSEEAAVLAIEFKVHGQALALEHAAAWTVGPSIRAVPSRCPKAMPMPSTRDKKNGVPPWPDPDGGHRSRQHSELKIHF